MLQILIPVLSAFQTNLKSWLAQNLYKRLLNVLVDRRNNSVTVGPSKYLTGTSPDPNPEH